MFEVFADEIDRKARKLSEKKTPLEDPSKFIREHNPYKPRPRTVASISFWTEKRTVHPGVKKVAEPVKEAVEAAVDKYGQPVKETAIKATIVTAIGATSALGARHHHQSTDRLASHHQRVTHSQGIGISHNPNYVVDNRIQPPVFNEGRQVPPQADKQPEAPKPKKAESVLTEEQKIVAELTRKAMAVVPDKPHIKRDAKIAVPLIIEALRTEGFTSNEVLAYALATAEWESKFNPGLEIDAEGQASANNYSGGERYAGRGYVQLTNDFNYKEIGDYIGYDLLNHPEMAEDPEIAARILAAYFKLHGTIEFAEKRQFLEARKTINGGEFDSEDPDVYSKPYDIRDTAQLYLAVLN